MNERLSSSLIQNLNGFNYRDVLLNEGDIGRSIIKHQSGRIGGSSGDNTITNLKLPYKWMKNLIIIFLTLSAVCQAQTRNTIILRHIDSTFTKKQLDSSMLTFTFFSTSDLKCKLDTLADKSRFKSITIFYDKNIQLPQSFFSFKNAASISIITPSIESTDKRLKNFKRLEEIEFICDTLGVIDASLAKVPSLKEVSLILYSLEPLMEKVESQAQMKELIPNELKRSAIKVINKRASKELVILIDGAAFYIE